MQQLPGIMVILLYSRYDTKHRFNINSPYYLIIKFSVEFYYYSDLKNLTLIIAL